MKNPKKFGKRKLPKKKTSQVDFTKLVEFLNQNYVSGRVFTLHKTELSHQYADVERLATAARESQSHILTVLSCIPELIHQFTGAPLEDIEKSLVGIYNTKKVVLPGDVIQGSVQIKKYNYSGTEEVQDETGTS